MNKKTQSRRSFIKTSVTAPIALASLSGQALASDKKKSPGKGPLPTRKLGKRGPEVTMLNMGGQLTAHSPQFLDVAWKNGIRYFDTAKVYMKGKSEKTIGRWLAKYPERRKDLFLVSKEPAKNGPEKMLDSIDQRLEACNTEYLDLFFLHGIGPNKHGEESFEWPKSDRFRKVYDKLKESGKAKMVGFSCHDGQVVKYLNAAAEGGFVDAIMLKYNPFFKKGDEFDQALEACFQAGIGLISMKEMKPFAKAPKNTPELEKVGLTTHQSLLHAVWSDSRIATICSGMENVAQIEENCKSARNFDKPLSDKLRKALKDVSMVSPVPMCPGCPSCREKAEKLDFAFDDISRYVCYYEQDGDLEAREYYRGLSSKARSASGIDLSVLKEGCQFKVDYPEIVRRAEHYFA